MTGENDRGFGKPDAAQTLRPQAEAKVAGDDKPLADMSDSEMSTLIRELRIHQVELEMQNEKLRKSQAETQSLRKAKNKFELRVKQRTTELVEMNLELRQAINDRKQAEQARQESEKRYRQLFENESDAVMIFDAETGRFEDANQATLNLYGYSKDDFLALNVEDISAEKEKTKSNVKRIRDGGEFSKQVPLRYFKKKDDTVFPGEINTARFTIGGRLKIMGAVRDISERQHMQDDLRKSEEFGRSLLANAPNPTLIVGLDTSVKYVNPAFEKLTGYLSSEILGARTPYPWWIEGLQSQTAEDFNQVFETGVMGLEGNFKKKNGEQFWVEIYSKPVRKDGELLYYLSSWIDTTERRQVLERLRASEEKYRTLVDNIAIGVALISPTMEILTINNQLRTWFPAINPAKKPLCYQVFNDPPGEGVCTYCPTIQTLQDGQVHESLTETPVGDETRNYRVISSPIKDAAGKVVAAIEMVDDVTERIRIQKVLQESERRFKTIFENVPIGFYRTTPDGRILDANPALMQMLGFSSFEELAAANLETDVYHPRYPRHQFRERIERDGVIKGKESLWVKSDKTLIYIRENTIAVRDENGAVVCYEGTIEDITDQKQALEHIQTLTQQVMKAQEDERRMLSRELHDTVAQELAVAKMGCDLIYNELLNGRQPQAQRIQTICDALQKTILDIRNMSYNLRPPELEELGLVETIYRFCEEFTQLWGVPVDFQAAGFKNLELGLEIQINLYRLVQEGLTNIRKHADAGRVTVKLTAAFPNIIFRIEDNGRGFDVQKRAAATGPEKRMGLRSMQERVKLLQGRMKLQSKPGQGTKITIKLPVEEKNSGV